MGDPGTGSQPCRRGPQLASAAPGWEWDCVGMGIWADGGSGTLEAPSLRAAATLRAPSVSSPLPSLDAPARVAAITALDTREPRPE